MLTFYIGRYGDESTAHLCLPARETRALLRLGNIGTIDQLRDLYNGGGLKDIRTLGSKSESEVIRAFVEFDKLKAQQEAG